MDFKRLDANFSGHFDEDSSWDAVPAGENGDIAVIVTVVAYNEALHFSKHHGDKKRKQKKMYKIL